MISTHNMPRSYQIDGAIEINEEAKPYLSLWAAVMNQADADAEKEHRLWEAGRNVLGKKSDIPLHQDRFEALRWVNSGEDHPGAFVWICELFGVDAGRARDSWFARQA